MRLKQKVSQQSKRPQGRAAQEEELAFLKSVESHIQTLQGAKLGADGLANIHCFLEGEAERDDNDLDGPHPERLHAGFHEITQALWNCLKRETGVLEREVWNRQHRLGVNPAPALVADAAGAHPSRKA